VKIGLYRKWINWYVQKFGCWYKPLQTLLSTPHSSGVAISLKRVGVGLGVSAKYLNEEFLVDLYLLPT